MKPFIPIYPGILDYLLRGDISRSELGLYVMMHAQADFSTGIWTGSAPRIDGTAPRGAELRATQREMKHLADVGLIKHFHKHGARGNFPWLINKYICRSGALRGKQLNATLSTSLRDLRYEVCAESDAESVAVSAPYQEVRIKKEEKVKPAAKPAQPADHRHKPFFDFAYESFRMKFLQPPSWGAQHAKGLQAFLKRSPQIDLAEWQRRYRAFLASTEPFYAQQKGSLLFFAAKFDSFIDGPILEKGNGSGKKLTGDALTEANLRATGLLQ